MGDDPRSVGNGLTQPLLLQMVDQLSELNGTVAAMNVTLSRIVPLVDSHEKHFNRSFGVRDRGRMIWGVLATTFAGGIGSAITFMIQRISSGSASH